MDLATAERRRRRRRVADVDRKRAPQACNICKRRKSKCVPVRDRVQSDPHAKCQRCSLGNLDCKFEKDDLMSPEASIQPASQAARIHSPTGSGSVVDENLELPSPASVLSQGLSKHVIADQSKRVLWPNILSRLREAFSLNPQHVPEEREMVAMQAHMIRPREMHPSELSRLNAAINAFPPRPVADFLLHVFMKHATDVFFYFDQAQVLADIEEFYGNPRSVLRGDPSFICLAMATFALGSQWTPLERPKGFESGQHKENVDIGREFSFHAKALLPDIIERSCLRSIQAPFILGVYHLPASAFGTSYVFLGLALRKALASDLHLDPEDTTTTDREKEIRLRLWWSIFSLERCTTIKLNRPRSIQTQIITVPYPSEYAALDRVQPFNNLECQVAYARLMIILDQIAGIVDGLSEPESLSQSKWQADLKAWKHSLPSNFKLDQIPTNDFKYRAVSHLYLNYYYAMITMGKVALVTVARKRLKQMNGERLDASDEAQNLANCCIKASRKTLQLFESFTRSRKITRFSFTDFQGCSIATIVTLVSGILERDSGYDTRVEFGLNCLRKMATGNMTAKLGVRFVEAVQSITEEAANKLQRAAASSSRGDSGSNGNSSYYQWAEWVIEQEGSHRNDLTYGPSEGTSSSREDRGLESDPWLTPQLAFREGSVLQTRVDTDSPQISSIPQETLSESSEMLQPLQYDFLSTLPNDEQSFLMGLTGLDALDFSDLTVELE